MLHSLADSPPPRESGDPGSMPEAAPPAEPFAIFDLEAWSRQPAEPTEFIMPGYVPAREVTLISGAGGANKSTFGQQLATCCAAGVDMLGIRVRSVSTLYLTAEDDERRLHWLQDHICRALDVPIASLAGKLHLGSLRGRLGNQLGSFDLANRLAPTETYHMLRATIERTGAGLVILDNAAHLFAGNENDRQQVTAFTNLLYAICRDHGATVALVSHSNKAGDSYSGSTAWVNAVRSQIVLEKPKDAVDPDERALTLGKANYARQGDELRFRWHNFALILADDLPEDERAGLAQVARDSADNDLFLACLDEMTRQQRPVSEKSGRNFAPVVFARMPESRNIGRDRIDAAMERLFRIGIIERAELWRGPDRKPVFGLRRRPIEGAGNAAGNGAETRCANAGNGHASA